MTKEELLDKYGVVFENFKPVPNADIKVTVDSDKVDLQSTSAIIEVLRQTYPDKAIFTTIKGLDIK